MREELPKLRSALSLCPDWTLSETAGLTQEEMAFTAQEPAWARWSIDIHMRHLALSPCTWLCTRGGEALRESGYEFPASAKTLIQSRQAGIRHVPPEAAPDREAVVSLMRTWITLACSIIDREKPERLRSLRFSRYVDPEEHRPGDPKRVIEYSRIAARLHPMGYTEDPDRPGNFTIEIGAALRHIFWETLAHLRNIQRIKNLLNLPAAVDLPREGYLTLSEFYD